MKLLKLCLFACLFSPIVVLAQPPACGTATPGSKSCTQYFGYNMSNQPIYACYALSTDTSSKRSANVVSISAATNANPVVLTSTAHGFLLTARPRVTISGATGSWTPINGTFTATVIDANTFSIAVNSTTFGALAGTITFITTAPRLGVSEWAIQTFGYDGSGNTTNVQWLNGNNTMNQKCTDAAGTTANVQ